MHNKNLINQLNSQLNREVTTFLRYMMQSAVINGEKHDRVRQMYQEEVMDEVGHAQYLADQIAMLGATPEINVDVSSPHENVETMLERDAADEKQDVKNYVELAQLAGKEGLISLKLQMEEQAADEERHGQQMYRYLGKSWS